MARKQPRLDSFVGKSTTGKALVIEDLEKLLSHIPKDAAIFAEIQDGKLCLPYYHTDRRVLTWTKLIEHLGELVINNPTSVKDCWFVPATKEDGYHESKLSRDGSGSKYRTHRLLYMLANYSESTRRIVEDRDDLTHAMHRCGRGKGRGKDAPTCINPHHIELGSSAENQDAKKCGYGAAFICPHTVKCIWTDAMTGRFKPCRNDAIKRSCTCPDSDCFSL